MNVPDRSLVYLVSIVLSFSIISSVAIFSTYEIRPFSITGMAQETGSGVANVTLASEANILLLVDIVEFNAIAATPGLSNDTTNFSPHPFVIENNGTARLNISISESSTDSLWEQNDSAHCFQFNSTVNNTLTLATSLVTAAWADFDGNNETANAAALDPATTPNVVWNLSTTDGGYDIVTVHLRIEVPDGEEGGVKEATMFFKGAQAA